jgi:tRNA(His) 5'-end guanylyltransferase
MLASFPAPAASFEVFAESQLVEGFFLAGHLRLRGTGTAADPEAAKALVKTAAHLLGASLGAVYAYAATGEIDVILRPNLPLPSPRGLLAQLAGQASAKHSLLHGRLITFDVRLYEFPRADLLQTYFRWRQEEAEARLLDEICAEALASAGKEPSTLVGMASEEKQELLRRAGVDWEALAPWQRRGAGLYLGDGSGADGDLVVESELPGGDTYQQFLAKFL